MHSLSFAMCLTLALHLMSNLRHLRVYQRILLHILIDWQFDKQMHGSSSNLSQVSLSLSFSLKMMLKPIGEHTHIDVIYVTCK